MVACVLVVAEVVGFVLFPEVDEQMIPEGDVLTHSVQSDLEAIQHHPDIHVP